MYTYVHSYTCSAHEHASAPAHPSQNSFWLSRFHQQLGSQQVPHAAFVRVSVYMHRVYDIQTYFRNHVLVDLPGSKWQKM